MKMAFRLTLSLILLAVVTCNVQAQSSEEETFEFSSTYAIGGDKGWEVSVDRAGNFSVKHYEDGGYLKDDGNFLLTEEENSKLWEVIQVEKFKTIEVTGRPRGHCNSYLIMTLKDGIQSHRVAMDKERAELDTHMIAIAGKITTLIEKYTGLTPHILW